MPLKASEMALHIVAARVATRPISVFAHSSHLLKSRPCDAATGNSWICMAPPSHTPAGVAARLHPRERE